MTESKTDVGYVTKLAQRAVSRFGGKLPPAVSHQDAVQDALVVILDWWDKYCPRVYMCAREPFLVMKAWGTLKDQYAKGWAQKYAEDGEGYRNPTNRPRFIEDKEAVAALPGYSPLASTDPDLTVPLDVRAAVSQLPPRTAQIMHLLLDGLTQEQIGEQLGLTQPRVSQIIASARGKLKKLLKDYECSN